MLIRDRLLQELNPLLITPTLTYQVQAGETLRDLAIRFYHDERLAEKLGRYNLIRQGMMKAALTTGLILQVPFAPTPPNDIRIVRLLADYPQLGSSLTLTRTALYDFPYCNQATVRLLGRLLRTAAAAAGRLQRLQGNFATATYTTRACKVVREAGNYLTLNASAVNGDSAATLDGPGLDALHLLEAWDTRQEPQFDVLDTWKQMQRGMVLS